MKVLWFAAAASVAMPWALAAQAVPAPDAGGKDEKKVCQTEKMTGSLTRVRRICLTRAEWDDLRLKTKHSFEDKVSGAAGGLETRPQPGAGG